MSDIVDEAMRKAQRATAAAWSELDDDSRLEAWHRELSPGERRAARGLYAERQAREAQIKAGLAWSDIGIGAEQRDGQEIWLRDGSPYAPDSPFSFFRDLTRAQILRSTIEAADGSVSTRGDLLPPSPVEGGEQEARRRLSTLGETRDVTIADPGAAAFIPSGKNPYFVREAFATAARARSVLAGLVPTLPLPKGSTVDLPKFQAGTSVAVQSEGSAVSETDADAELVSSKVTTLAGQNDLSIQAIEYIDGGMGDAILAADLGRAYAAKLDAEMIDGDNSAGPPARTMGLLAVSGVTATAYTDATSTQAEFWGQLMANISAVATALGYPPTHVLAHPRRIAWLYNWKDAGGMLVRPVLPFNMSLVEVPAIGTAYGAGTEDKVIVTALPETRLFTNGPTFRVLEEVLAGTLQVRVQAYGFAAFNPQREPKGLGVVAGTGLIAPVFT